MNDSTLTDTTIAFPVSVILVVPRGANRLAQARKHASALLGRSQKERQLVLRGAHPDLIELTSKTGKEKIGISQIREVIHQAQFAPTQAHRKVCLVPEAEQLTTEAANALLKIVEEPPRGLIFLFLTENREDLLPTIVSRSQVVRVTASDDSQLFAGLISAGYSQTDARYLAAIAQNNDELSRLISRTEDTAKARKKASQLVTQAEDNKLVELVLEENPILQYAATHELFTRLGRTNRRLAVTAALAIARAGRDRTSQLLDVMLVVCFSALHKTVINGSCEGDQPGHFSLEMSWSNACRSIQRAQRALQRYTFTEGVLLWLFLGIARGE
jgi:hypothetical protein